MRAYLHRGAGAWIGSAVLVFAKTRKHAEALIRVELDSSGLKSEKLEVEHIPIKTGVAYSYDGDY